MIQLGLVSITFRQLGVERIIELVQSAQLTSIEWGGDVHVPHGDLKQAEIVSKMMMDAGLSVSAYGSYYRLAEDESPPIEAVLDTAEALGAPIVRVWAGRRGSQDADADYRQAVIADAIHITEQATARSLCISLEFHKNTLTDSLESTIDLLKAVNHNNFRTFWQPTYTYELELRILGLKTLLSQITNIHVDTRDRYSLARDASDWAEYIKIIQTSDRDHVLSLEFVCNNDPDVFMKDANTLHQWLD